MNKNVRLINKGLIDYKECWAFQTDIFDAIIQKKISIRKGETESVVTDNFLLFCEHPHVYTLGKTGEKSNLLLDFRKFLIPNSSDKPEVTFDNNSKNKAKFMKKNYWAVPIDAEQNYFYLPSYAEDENGDQVKGTQGAVLKLITQ